MELITYRIKVQWQDGTTTEERIKAGTESKAETHIFRRSIIKKMSYKILSIDDY